MLRTRIQKLMPSRRKREFALKTAFAWVLALGQVLPAYATIDNTAIATGTYAGTVTSQPSSASVTVLSPVASMSLLKTPGGIADTNGNGVTDAGDTASWTFGVTNTGNVTLTDVTVSDAAAVVAGGPLASLAPGATDSATFTASHVLTQADIDAGGVENSATATGSSPGNTGDVTDVSDAGDDTVETPGLGGTTDGDPANDPTVTVLSPVASMSLLKTPGGIADTNGNGVTDAGDTASWTFGVTNTGNVTLTDVTVSDAAAVVAGGPLASLAPGATDSATFTASHVLTQADIDAGGVENSATATGSSPGNTGDVTDVSDAGDDTVETPGLGGTTDGDPANDPTVTVLSPVALMSLLKTPGGIADTNGNGVTDAGDTASWTFGVTNTGNVTLTDVTVSDAAAVVAGGPLASLAPGATDSATFTASHVLTQADIDAGGVENSATATGSSPGNTGDVTDVSDAGDDTVETPGLGGTTDGDPANDPTVTVLSPVALMSLLKTPGGIADTNGNGVTDAGDTASWTFGVTNTGNVTLTDVTVSDAAAVVAGGPLASLAPGATDSATFTASHVLTQADIDAGGVENSATATGSSPGNTGDVTDVSDAGDDTVETPGLGGTTDGDPANDPTVIVIEVQASLGGYVFTDQNGNGQFDPASDPVHGGYTVELVLDGVVIAIAVTNPDGSYSFPNVAPGKIYDLVFKDPAGSVVGGIAGIELKPGENLVDQNLPIDPSGIIYDSVTHQPIAGAIVTLANMTGQALPAACFIDPSQQNQVTGADGGYRFDIIPGTDPACPATETAYQILVQVPSGYQTPPSTMLPPMAGPVDVTTCIFDATPGGACQPASSANPPAQGAAAVYVLSFLIQLGDPALIHNHIPLDPNQTTGQVTITKVAEPKTIHRGDKVHYTITVHNEANLPAGNVHVTDLIPTGFAYVAGTATVNGVKTEPVINGKLHDFGLIALPAKSDIVIKLTLVALASAGPGEYVNRARVTDEAGNALAADAKAVVEILAEPVFDCSDVIGKVFDDKNGNGFQDKGEPGLAGVRLVTVKGGIIRADKYGRFHVPCAELPDADIGSNFILKLDTRTLPGGYRLTTENPRVVRLTAGKMTEMNFGATRGRDVKLQLADEAFEAGSATLKPKWTTGIDRLATILAEQYSHLQIDFVTSEERSVARERMKAVETLVKSRFRKLGGDYELQVDSTITRR